VGRQKQSANRVDTISFSAHPGMPNEADLSKSESIEAICPICATKFTARKWRIVDADHRPNLLIHAVDGSLQRSFCPECIGPGIEHPGSFRVLKRKQNVIQWIVFFQCPSDQIEVEASLIDSYMKSAAAQAGIPLDTFESLGSRLLIDPDDVRNRIADTWPDLKLHQDPAIFPDALYQLLNAAANPERADVLRAYPDLVRPNIELLLSLLAEQADKEMGIAAIRAWYFAASVRGLGLMQAVKTLEAEDSRPERYGALPDSLQKRFLAFMDASPDGSAATSALGSEAEALSKDLDQAGFPGAKTEVWFHVAQWLARRSDEQDSLPLAARAYQRARDALEPDRNAIAYAILHGLSSTFDLRRDGSRSANVEKALEYARTAREHARSLPADDQAEAAMEEGLLYLHRPSGDPVSNRALAREALDFAIRTALTSKSRLLAKYNLALVDIEDPNSNSLDRGFAWLKAMSAPQAKALFDKRQQQNLMQSFGVALAKRAFTHQEPEALDGAATSVEQALSLALERQAPADAAFLYRLLAQIETDRVVAGRGKRDLGDIWFLLDKAESLIDPQKAPTDYAQNEIRRFTVLDRLAEPALARPLMLDALTKACQHLSPESHPDLCRRAESQRGDLLLHSRNFQAAAQSFRIACDASDRLYSSAESVAQRQAEIRNNTILHEGLIESLSRIPNRDADIKWQMVEAMESSRARLTLDLMGLRPLPPFSGIPEEWIEQESALIAELAWTLPGAGAELAPEDPDLIRAQRDTRAQLAELWEKIANSGDAGRRYVALRRTQPIKRKEIASFVEHLGPHAAVASFFVLQGSIFLAWLQSGAEPRVETIPLSRQDLQEIWIERFKNDVFSAEAKPAHAWMALGELLFAQVAEFLPELDLLVLIPHGDLHMLPLHALHVGGEPLIAQTPVIYGPSIGILDSIVQADMAAESSQTALVGSNAILGAPDGEEDLKDFQAEADIVAELLGVNARHQASREEVIAEAPAAGSIHLVCHGYFDADDPLNSGIALDGGVMSARDWLPLGLHARLVTLSACDTGRQQVETGDELNGLARTLLQAGCSSVLLTLWRVYSDAAANWMKSFYTEWAGESPVDRAIAFQRATGALRAEDPDPRAWAPFILIGDSGIHINAP